MKPPLATIALIVVSGVWVAAQQAATPPPTFDVVSIKPNPSGTGDGRIYITPGGRVEWPSTTLRRLLGLAYMRHAFDSREIVGGPFGALGWEGGATDYGVYSSGNAHVGGTFTATTKSFVEPHPSDASKEIRYVSLEGPRSVVRDLDLMAGRAQGLRQELRRVDVVIDDEDPPLVTVGEPWRRGLGEGALPRGIHGERRQADDESAAD